VAEFAWSCTELACSFDAAGSTDPDGVIVSYAWDFGDDATASGVVASHTFSTPGSYGVSLTVTDDDDASDGTSHTVTPGLVAATLHVTDLDGLATLMPRDRWTAQVTITVKDQKGLAVPSADVTGTWSGGAKGDSACTTDSSGICTVEKRNLKTSSGPVTFTVVGVAHATLSYAPDDNTDADGDSDGTVISVAVP
jgi:PKD repeat protein